MLQIIGEIEMEKVAQFLPTAVCVGGNVDRKNKDN
jgi:hypothetical protein